MATGATLAVRILADISDFEKNLPKAERAFLKTADKLTTAGKKLSLGVTLPLVALGGAIAKAAADDEASVLKLQRTFGTSAKTMEAWIGQLMRTVPATDDELRGLAVSTDTLLRSMGLSVPAAQSMTQAVTQLAGDLAAYNNVGLDVAQDALGKALQGQTRGLQEFGVVINQADVKQRAYQLGIAKTGAELTHAQTAQASWSLILEKTKLQQGESARTIDDNAHALARLRQAADSAGDSFGAVVLPTAAKVVGAVANVLNTMANLPPVAKGVIVSMGAVAAATGPAIVGFASLSRGVVELRHALTLLSGTTALAGIPVALGAVAVAAGLIAAPIAAVVYAFSKEGEAARTAASDLDTYRVAIANLTPAQLKLQAAASQGVLQSLEAKRSSLASQLANLPKAGTPGYDVSSTPDQARALATELNNVVAQQTSVRAGFDAIIARIVEVNKAAAGGGEGGPSLADTMKDISERASLVTQSVEQIKKGWGVIPGLGRSFVDALRDAESILARMPNKMDPIAVKAREIIQSLNGLLPGTDASGLPVRVTPQSPANLLNGIHVQAAKLPAEKIAAGFSQVKETMEAGFQDVAVSIGDTLANNLSSKIFGWLTSHGNGLGIGGQIGGGLGSAFGGGVGGQLGGIAAKSVGGLIGAGVGSVIPVAGTLLGGVIGSAIGGLFGHHKKATDNAADSLNRLATTAQKVNETLSNLPQGFKIAYDRFLATTALGGGSGDGGSTGGGSGGGSGGSTPPGGGDGRTVGNFTVHIGDAHFHGVTDVAQFAKQLGEHVEAQFSRGGTTPLTLAFGR